MPKRSRKEVPQDFNQVAYQVVKKATAPSGPAAPSDDEVSRIMALMGRKGGLKGGKRRLETMTLEQRREAAFKAAKARWAKPKKRKR